MRTQTTTARALKRDGTDVTFVLRALNPPQLVRLDGKFFVARFGSRGTLYDEIGEVYTYNSPTVKPRKVPGWLQALKRRQVYRLERRAVAEMVRATQGSLRA